MDVEVAEEHTGVGGGAAVLPRVAGGGGLEEPGWGGLVGDVVGLLQNQLSKADSGVGPAHLLEVVTPFLPLASLVGEDFLDQVADLFSLFGNRPDAEPADEPGVAFLLPGDDLVDDHGAAGGNGFLDHGSAGLRDKQVMRHEQARHLVSPAIDPDPVPGTL